MAELRRCLKQHEPFVLDAIFEKYRIREVQGGLFDRNELLAQHLLNKKLFQSILESLSPKAQAAFDALNKKRKIRADLFFSLYGDIRVMGETRFKREMPYSSPENASEELWYAGILYKGMFDEGNGLQEFVILPTDLQMPIPERKSGSAIPAIETSSLIIRPAMQAEMQKTIKGGDEILDIGALLLASIRLGQNDEILPPVYGEKKIEFATELFRLSGILDDALQLNVTPAQLFLQKDRISALLQLFQVWQSAETYDELDLIPEFFIDPLFHYSPLNLRLAILSKLATIQDNRWWSVFGLIAAIKNEADDFLRDQNENEPWLIRNTEKEDFRKWENIEGVYISSLINGPMHWLGMVDLGFSESLDLEEGSNTASAFRMTGTGIAFLNPQNGMSQKIIRDHRRGEETQTPSISIDGKITVTSEVPRILRYHIARFCEWEKIQPELWRFRVTPVSLRKARESGLKVNAFVRMLKRANQQSFPIKLEQAVSKWDQAETQSSVFEAVLLTVTDPAWIDALMNSKDTAHWIEQRLNANTLIVKPKGVEIIRRVLIEKNGVLTEILP